MELVLGCGSLAAAAAAEERQLWLSGAQLPRALATAIEPCAAASNCRQLRSTGLCWSLLV